MSEHTLKFLQGIGLGVGSALISSAIFNSGILSLGPITPVEFAVIGVPCFVGGIIAGVLNNTEGSNSEVAV